jgi:hypothetical protein
MKQSLWAAIVGFSCLGLSAAPTFAKMMMIAPAPIAQRVAVADAVVVGKVTAFGDKLISAAAPFPGNKVDYQIAIVRIDEALLGAKGAKEIKVGFLPPAPSVPGSGPGPVQIIKRRPGFILSLDQEACLFLTKHPDADFYIGQNYFDVINKKGNARFDTEMDEVKRCVKLLADPAASLKADNADDRFLTAAMLVTRYRTPKTGFPSKTKAIDADLSKQILLALADADWTAKAAGPGFQLTPQAVFFRLGLTEKDGWAPPKDFNKIPDEAKKWLKENADKYRLERFVADRGDK